jgi:hypothetical protein
MLNDEIIDASISNQQSTLSNFSGAEGIMVFGGHEQ